MTELLYLKDSYIYEFEAKVVDIVKGGVVLNRTAFYVSGGGQPGDRGILKTDEKEYGVIDVIRRDGKVVHVLDTVEGIEKGASVTGIIDWDGRYKLMRMHTAAHILSGLIFEKFGSFVTGNQLGEDRSRIDFDLETLEDSDLKWLEKEANRVVEEGKDVVIEFMPAEKAFEIPQIIKLKHVLPKHLKELKVVRINDVDVQACGGTHVRNTKEIGRIRILKKESKGREHKRIYFTVE